MWKEVLNYFSPPIFPEDEDKTRQARYSFVIALAFLGLALTYEIFIRLFAGYAAFSNLDLILFGVALVCTIGLHFLKRGAVQFISLLLVAMVWLASNSLALTGYGAKDASYLVNFAIVLMAGLLLGWPASALVTVLSILSGIALANAEENGLIRTSSYAITAFARDIAFVFAINGLLIFLLIRGMEIALKKSRLHLLQLESANASLQETQDELEHRSAELLQANQQLQDRTRKLQAIAMIARAAASMKSFEDLISFIPRSISKQLGYEEIRVFLLDERKEFAILRSTHRAVEDHSREAQSRVSVRQSSAFALVLQTGQARVLGASEREAVFGKALEMYDFPLELLLPLKAGDQMVGILDIHSSKLDDFSADDISELSVLADQLAITLQNLLLYEQSQNALREADSSSRRAAAEGWRGYGKTIEMQGYRYDGIKSEPVRTVKLSSSGAALAVPIQLRGQTIGSFKLNPSDSSRTWTDDELAMVRATAERVALALEGARLLEDAQKRATREAFLSEISTKLSASFQLDSILRDTVQELGQTLRHSTVTFQLVDPANLKTSPIEKPDEAAARGVLPGAEHE